MTQNRNIRDFFKNKICETQPHSPGKVDEEVPFPTIPSIKSGTRSRNGEKHRSNPAMRSQSSTSGKVSRLVRNDSDGDARDPSLPRHNRISPAKVKANTPGMNLEVAPKKHIVTTPKRSHADKIGQGASTSRDSSIYASDGSSDVGSNIILSPAPRKPQESKSIHRQTATSAKLSSRGPGLSGDELDQVASPPTSKSLSLRHTSPTEPVTTSSSSSSRASNGTREIRNSSQRVVNNILKAVTRSESDSSLTDLDDSDDELGDVYQFVPQKRMRMSPPKEDVDMHDSGRSPGSARRSTRLAKQETKRHSLPLLPSSPPQQAYKHSLADMIARRQRLNKAEAVISNLENEIVEAKKREETYESESQDGKVDGRLLADTAESDSDERDRMMQALVRVEAGKQKERYRFFLDHKPVFENIPFPVGSLPDGIWHRVMADDHMRVQACISGFVAEIVPSRPLPLDITLWMAKQLTHECNDVLCEAYLNILQASLVHEEFMSDTIGRLSCFYKTRSFSESLWRNGKSTTLPYGLSYLVRAVGFTAPKLDARISEAAPSDTSAAVLDFASLAIDELAQQDTSLAVIIMRSIESMLDALPEKSLQMLTSDVTQTLFEPNEMSSLTRCRLISTLPAGTVRANNLRRRLALECFATKPNRSNSTNPLDWPEILVTALKTKPELSVSDATDYELLVALVSVLDLAVGPGFFNLHLLYQTQVDGTTSEIITEPNTTLVPADRHNKQVDAIVIQLQAMSSRIRDAGASHLRRTEAKSAIEHVIVRLEHGVRTKPRGKKGIFDSGKIDEKGLMGFFGRNRGRADQAGDGE